MKSSLALFLSVTTLAVLTACGGGGGDNNTTGGTSNNIQAINPLTKYVGSYQSCNGNHTNYVQKIAEATDTSISSTLRFDYYENANCSGAIVGNLIFPSPLTYKFDGNSTVSTTGIQPTTVNLSVDKLLISAPQMTLSLIGTGVKNVNGQLCVTYTNGNTCPNSLNNPEVNGYAAAIYMNSSDLYLLLPSGSGYKVDTHSTKI